MKRGSSFKIASWWLGEMGAAGPCKTTTPIRIHIGQEMALGFTPK
jgi:hypothetical protein